MINGFTPPSGLHIRPARASDSVFLAKLHREVRNDLQFIDGEKDFVDCIVDMQQKAQTQSYGDQFPNAMYFVIEKHHELIGRATIDFGCNEVRLIDLAFLTAARNHGFGKAIIQSFQLCSAKVMLPMTLCVARDNLLAKKLYLSLGFRFVTQGQDQTSSIHQQMIWYPLTHFHQERQMVTF